MRRVHADELTERIAHARGRLRLLQRRCRRLRDVVGETTARLVLGAKHGCEIDQPAGFLETGKQKVLFEFLVVVLNEGTDDLGAIANRARRQVLFGIDAADGFLVDEKHPLQDTVFAHEVFGRRDLRRLLFRVPGSCRASFLIHKRSRQERTATDNRAHPQERTSVRFGCSRHLFVSCLLRIA